MKVTIEMVAKRAGVSKATVSRIINGNYLQTTQETKERILQVIEEMNYKPNLLAKGLKQMKTNVLGIVLSNLKNPFWTRVLEGFEDTCRKSGYSLMICNSNEDGQLEEELIRDLRHRMVDGIVVNPTPGDKQHFMQLVDEHYPIVIINRKVEGIDADSVTVDNRAGARLAVEHLLKLGRRRLAIMVHDPVGVSTWQERIDGFCETLREHGVPPEHYEVCIVPQQNEGEVKKAVIDLLERFSPDAIFSTNNMMTLEIMDGIHEYGWTIPDQIALLGYDETVWSKHLQPALTTISQPSYEMGALAAQKLISRIKSKNEGSGATTTVLEPSLIVRKSCGSGIVK
ncbi:LacI family DNA-binding transcriptional regulator [Paenibacillus turpanensis]|uniref:LacI family DNA-binding transcriptional regulator n=1 Tax=Paenibacillus turpanensis TaxID=2689078 RepID=UPI001408C40E|nr:LacI family DNA-binding transcriptional regulator [Paenibacillus turpanensis]